MLAEILKSFATIVFDEDMLSADILLADILLTETGVSIDIVLLLFSSVDTTIKSVLSFIALILDSSTTIFSLSLPFSWVIEIAIVSPSYIAVEFNFYNSLVILSSNGRLSIKSDKWPVNLVSSIAIDVTLPFDWFKVISIYSLPEDLRSFTSIDEIWLLIAAKTFHLIF